MLRLYDDSERCLLFGLGCVASVGDECCVVRGDDESGGASPEARNVVAGLGVCAFVDNQNKRIKFLCV